MTPEQNHKFLKLFEALILEVREIRKLLEGDWSIEEESEESPAPDN